jgi:ferredoxin
MVVFAVGQEADLGPADECDLVPPGNGRLGEDVAPGIFACGEIVTGPGGAIEAIADGHRCAGTVLSFLQSRGCIEVPAEGGGMLRELPEDVVRGIRRVSGTPVRVLEPEVRRKSFQPVEFGYEEAEALREAWRCLACAAGADVDESKCAACLACVRVCPYDVPVVGRTAVMLSERCQSCGLCAPECPARAISIARLAGLDLPARISRLLEQTPEAVDRVEIVCARDANSREELADCVVAENGLSYARFPVSCAALADEVAMMKPFEFGVGSVSVVLCRECGFEGAEQRLAGRAERVRRLLDDVGIGGVNLSLCVPEPAGEGRI